MRGEEVKAYAAFVRNTEEIVLSTIRRSKDDVRRVIDQEVLRTASLSDLTKSLLVIREIDIDWVSLGGEYETKTKS